MKLKAIALMIKHRPTYLGLIETNGLGSLGDVVSFWWQKKVFYEKHRIVRNAYKYYSAYYSLNQWVYQILK